MASLVLDSDLVPNEGWPDLVLDSDLVPNVMRVASLVLDSDLVSNVMRVASLVLDSDLVPDGEWWSVLFWILTWSLMMRGGQTGFGF